MSVISFGDKRKGEERNVCDFEMKIEYLGGIFVLIKLELYY